ncbi:MAG: dTDP-4-dehydrorhamnose reductase, partial [Spartobacteria bacterium]|nr:dTDP-4-dehydrorhamnose reductase [Spartobacteria bacterium]
MQVVIVGANGMLGTDLMSVCRAHDVAVRGVDLPEVDITTYSGVADHMPPADCIINCAAFTNVDGAEEQAKAAFAVNAEGPGHLAAYCHRKHIKLIHISTDYVFDGKKGRSYTEWNEPNPISVYGASKLAGEKAIRAEGCDYFIVRTQSLFGLHGHNFVKAILKRVRAGNKELRVVNDQVSSPTYTPHLAEALLQLLPLDKTGIIHLSARGACSWFEFAQA